MTEPRFTNALINETSPYLLQHAHNPVNWHPWCEEALARAKQENKPILLSIGYSSCHWCHVMAHESFEDEATARLMNDHFINIKVDREERPDLDAIYMAAVQMTTGNGGWPMTVFLTPDQVPFFCGTYFPPEDRHGLPAFRRVLEGVAGAYRNKREVLERDGRTIVSALQNMNAMSSDGTRLNPGILEQAASGFASNYDPQNGGFGRAPKFPPSMALSFLMRSFNRTGEKKLLAMVEQTLTRMASGGIFDHVGGGFHRYAVDAEWLVPHFEKMLYDNALLSRAYLDGYLLTMNARYRQVAEDVLDYVLREMTSPEGGFYASQDADSEGKEGEFFLWTVREVLSLLGDRDGSLFCRYYGITPEGNFEGKSILHVARSGAMVARLSNVDEADLMDVVRRGRSLLYRAREARVRPGRDEKILTAWNGLMLRSFAEAANAFGRKDYLQAAVRNARFLLSNLCGDGQVFRSYKNGKARLNGYLDDYACLIDGLIALYEADFDAAWIREASRVADLMGRKFRDPDGKGFYLTSDDHEALIHRPKDFLDNAAPCGNSVACHALLRLWKLTGNFRWAEYAVPVLENVADLMARQPAAFPNFLCALDFYLGNPKEVAVIGDPDDGGTRTLLREIFRLYRPNKVVACGKNGELPLLESRPQIDGLATAYVCENFTCGLPVTAPEDLSHALESRAGAK